MGACIDCRRYRPLYFCHPKDMMIPGDRGTSRTNIFGGRAYRFMMRSLIESSP